MEKELQKIELKNEFRGVELAGEPPFYRFNE